MSTPEQSTPRPPFAEIEMADIFMRTHAEIAARIIEELQARGLYSPDLLYCGVEGTPIRTAGGFGDRQTTFAVEEGVFLREAENYDKYGSGEALSGPLMYALRQTERLPAIAIFRPDSFLQSVESYVKKEWQLLEGRTMDEAAVAVIYLDESNPLEEEEFGF